MFLKDIYGSSLKWTCLERKFNQKKNAVFPLVFTQRNKHAFWKQFVVSSQVTVFFDVIACGTWKRAFHMPCKQVHWKISQHFFPPWPYRDYIFKKWIFVKLIGTICWFVRRLIQPTYYELHLTGVDEIWRGVSNYRWLHNMRGPPWEWFQNSYGLAWAAFAE